MSAPVALDEPKPRASGWPLQILILEDVPLEAQLVESELRRGKIQFVARRVTTREAFVAALQETAFDLIFADYKLPDFDGLTALALAQELCPDTPFILVSGQISEEMAIEAVNGGAIDYVFKDHLGRLLPSVHRALREVRERKRRQVAESALRASEQRYRMLVERSRDGILQFDQRGQLAFANPRAVEILGCERARLVAQPAIVNRLLHPASWRQFLAVLEEFEATGRLPEQAAEWRWVRPDGRPVFTENLFTDLVNDVGRRIGFQIVLRDITDKKRAEVELRRSYAKLRRIFYQTVNTLSSAVGKRDPYTGGHQHRVAQLARSIAEELKLPPGRAEGIFFTGLLHDIGKINIPGEVLNRSGSLTEAEMLMIRTHPEVGYQILKNIEFPWPVAMATVQHHEHLDGSGYPAGLKGDQIILEARILTVADVIEGMASHRPYRPALGIKKALQETARYSGIRYDPAVVECSRRLFEELRFQFDLDDAASLWANGHQTIAEIDLPSRGQGQGQPPGSDQ